MGRGSPAAPYLAVLAHPPDEQRVLQGDVEAPAGDADIWGAWRGGAGDHGGCVTPPGPPEPDGATLLLTPAHADARPRWHPPRTPPHLHGLGAARGPPQLPRLRLAAPPQPSPTPPSPSASTAGGCRLCPSPGAVLTFDVPAFLPHLVDESLCGGEGCSGRGRTGGSPSAPRGGPAPARTPALSTKRGKRTWSRGHGAVLAPVPWGRGSRGGAAVPRVRSSMISLTLGFSVVLFLGFLAGGGGA